MLEENDDSWFIGRLFNDAVLSRLA